MQLRVNSEIGRLREVLVHAPGPEVDDMPPSMMHELLFDDIIYGKRARQEHAQFRAIMEAVGIVVHDAETLLKNAMENAPETAIHSLIETIARFEELAPSIRKRLLDVDHGELASVLVQGISTEGPRSSEQLFHLDPVPNLLFSRDAQIVLGSKIIFSAMSRSARQREPRLSRFAFEHALKVQRESILIDFLDKSESDPRQAWPTIEGGDVLVLNEGVVIVGISERTSEHAVDLLAARLRADEKFHTLITVPMPRTRSVMHLDTIFTRTSREECLVYAPMILGGHAESLSVNRVDLRKKDDWGTRRPNLLSALSEVGVDLEPIYCGGQNDYVRQTREQWTDGANCFALAPGVIFLYERNEATALELSKRGYEVLSAKSMDFSPDGRCRHSFMADHKYALLIAGEELSRARGGPRCMTMPLQRDEVC